MGITANGSATSRELGCPHPEERACASASAKSNERARVSKDEDGHGAGLHASRRIAAQPTRASVCVRAAMLLSMRARRILTKRSQWRFGRRSRGKPTCGCKKWPPAPYHCFRPVIYNDPRNLRAYGDSDGFWRNERNAHFGETKPTRFWRKQLRRR